MYDNLYMYGYLSISAVVGWAKAPLRRAYHLKSKVHRPMVGTPPDAFAPDVSAHPTNWFQPYRRVTNLLKLFR
jgi:hypothetical protein